MPDQAEEVRRIRGIVHHGEIYLCRADLIDAIEDMAGRMPNDEDRAVAKGLVTWVKRGTSA
jgi:hypothetical protein